ncbi:MAG: PAS domain-containing protein [Bacteroidetes bacterium]|nr:MAG: PAS domain-containing protein [Bacteroidota bacterium]
MILFSFRFDLTFLPSALLAFIPFLVNAGIFIYVFFILPKTRLNILFSFFLVTLALWQFTETMVRLSSDAETAKLWYTMLNPAANFISPLAMHFALIFTRNRHWLKRPWVILAIYVPALFFTFATIGGFVYSEITPSPFWRWVFTPANNLVSEINGYWIGALAWLVLVILIIFCRKSRKTTNLNRQAQLVTIGFAIPALQGMITEVIFPVLLKLDAIPVTGTSMCVFSICIILALNRYHMFTFSPKHAWNRIVDHMNDGILIIDSDEVIHFANTKLCHMLGYSRDELFGQVAREFLFEKQYHEMMKNAIERRKQNIADRYEVPLRTKNGEYIWCEISASPYTNAKNEVIGSIGILTDITERKRIRDQINQKVHDLNTFVYRASHDLKGPLSSVNGLINVARMNLREPNAHQYLDMISKSTARLDQIIGDLTDITIITQGKIEMLPIDLENEISRILESLNQQTGFSALKIESSIVLEKPLITDHGLLRAILQNLIANAIKYTALTRKNPELNIQAQRVNGHIQIVIADNGPGIPEKVQPRIWDMFFRAHEESKGTGLGLFIVRCAIEKLGGSITLQSKEKEGSVFTVCLPQQYPHVANAG